MTISRFFISKNGEWNADPIEPCMIEAMTVEHHRELVAEIKAELAESQRLHDAGGSRELKLMTRVKELEAENAEQQAKLTKICIDGGYDVCARCGELIEKEADDE